MTMEGKKSHNMLDGDCGTSKAGGITESKSKALGARRSNIQEQKMPHLTKRSHPLAFRSIQIDLQWTGECLSTLRNRILFTETTIQKLISSGNTPTDISRNPIYQ